MDLAIRPHGLHARRRSSVAALLAMLALVPLALVLLAPEARAEEWTPTRSFRIFSKANYRGLPQSSVVALAQDADGPLSIRNLDRPAPFDGRAITPVAAVAGAPLRGVISAIEPRQGGG